MLKHFYPPGRGLVQEWRSLPLSLTQGVNEWFDEYKNDMNHMLWPSQSPRFNPV